MKKIIILSAILVLAFTTVSMAGSEIRIGSAGAQELRIPVGSRGTSLGGAIGADVIGTDAIFYNPAGVAFTEGTEAMFSHVSYFADMDLNYFAVAKTIEDFGSIGFAAKVLSVGEIVKTSEDASTVDGTGSVYEPTMAVLSVTYSRIMTDRVSFGITGKFINESIDLASASGIAVDFGINYDTKWNGLRFGLVINNIGPQMEFTGAGFDNDVYDGEGVNPDSPNKTWASQSAAFEIPSWITFSSAIDVYNETKSRASFYGTFESNNFSKDLYRAGFEYAFDESYFLRAGYTLDQKQEDYLYGLTMGAGLSVKLGDTDVLFEYSWSETEFFDNIQYFTGKIQF